MKSSMEPTRQLARDYARQEADMVLSAKTKLPRKQRRELARALAKQNMKHAQDRLKAEVARRSM